MNNFTNMKIAVTADQPLEDIVVELERLGYEMIDIDGGNYNHVVTKTNGFGFILNENKIPLTYKPTTLAELKEM